ncbi:TIGR01906 family membrane protein [Oceanirhabdus sp. W0125-5]|uniref:TIGR01906 family membrane protein n=1 Tax=Oceanirhabdus sp. W0125-5 TaxID=2999116 RepID=UPI0022F2D12F|nr:TIGR01906 family membrane protein [Oceanirhabdus sp. W0125-5]WBW95023.1 TIGR01906 family membrane protein [Oceanirhabdus sp. W0125-5]
MSNNIKQDDKNKPYIFLCQILTALSLTLFVITLSVNLSTLNKGIYAFSIKNLKIEDTSGMKKSEMVQNYNSLVDNLYSNSYDFNLPTLPSSTNGEIHFIEVKKIYDVIQIIFYISGSLSLLGLILIKRGYFRFLKWSVIASTATPILLGVLASINLDKSFTIFHKIFFNNDYWHLDPTTDPVIDILPQEFFYFSGASILLLILTGSIILLYTYKRKITTFKPLNSKIETANV